MPMLSRWTLGLLLRLGALNVAGARAASMFTDCYHRVEGIQRVTSPGGSPCGVVAPGVFLTCCAVGDQCVQDGLCHIIHDMPREQNKTGYYLGGCTDPSLEDPVCNKGCDSLKDSDVVFDVPSKTWFCCGATDEGLITCNDPTKLVVSARPRPKLETTFVAQRTVLTTDVPPSTSETTTDATQSTSATTTTTSAPTITPTTPASSATEMPIPVEAEKVESNTGAIVGGVVGGVAAIAIIAGAVWFFYRRQQGQGPAQPPGYVPSHGFFGFVAEKPHNPRAELVTTERPVEMAGQRHSLAEMP